MWCRESIFVEKSTIDFLILSYFLMQSFLFFLFSQSWVSYFPIYLSNHAAGHPAALMQWVWVQIPWGPAFFLGLICNCLNYHILLLWWIYYLRHLHNSSDDVKAEFSNVIVLLFIQNYIIPSLNKLKHTYLHQC